jgi:hypothetical protein
MDPGGSWRDIARAMSQENVEIVRRFFGAIEQAFDAYWENPRSIAAALEARDLWPEWVEAYEFLHPQIEWQTVFLGETARGYLQAARLWDDFLNGRRTTDLALKRLRISAGITSSPSWH